MDARSVQSDSHPDSIEEQTPKNDQSHAADPPLPDSEHDFNESKCLFCNQTNQNLDQNLDHMLKAHGLYIDPAHLSVDIPSLLAYFHLVIFGAYECLYCGTQRNTCQAVQQHMMAKGHCKYDITNEVSEVRDFYNFEPSGGEEDEDLRSKLAVASLADDSRLPPQARWKQARRSKRLERQEPYGTASPLHELPPTSTPEPDNTTKPDSNPETHTLPQSALITRSIKQEHTLKSHLSQLSAEDRRSLIHLPASKQRSLLATRHKQIEKARRTEQVSRGNLETAGNKTNCLDKIKLVRKPPHTGNVFSLNR